jgi:quercetin dioxygenase-like cupin family protein
VTQAAATPSVKYEDQAIRITEWRFAPGAATGWHHHEYGYSVVPLLDGKLGLDNADGSHSVAELRRGIPYGRPAGVEHDVININDFEYSFLEIELKR